MKPIMAIIGEAPGAEEDAAGEPFVGPAGRLLKAKLNEAGINPKVVHFTNVISCFEPNTPVLFSNILSATRRPYEGMMVDVQTSRGVLSGTPNHPVLTTTGWVALNEISEGDYIVRCDTRKGMPKSNPYVYEAPSRIDDVFRSLSNAGIGKRVIGRNVDFHGDGSDSYVDIVGKVGLLGGAIASKRSKHANEDTLESAAVVPALKIGFRSRFHGLSDLFGGALSTARRYMSVFKHMMAFTLRCVFPTNFHGLASPTYFNPASNEFRLQREFRSVAQLRQWLKSGALLVEFDRVLQTAQRYLSGHVYNLHTKSNIYIAHNYIVHNCRPDDNNISSPDAQEALICCGGGLIQELEALRASGVKILVPLGNTALTALGISGTITKSRGSVYGLRITGGGLVEDPAKPDFWAVPTFHPSFILRGMQKEEPTWMNDMAKALELAQDGYEPPAERFVLNPTIEQVESLAEKLAKKPRLIGVDIETSGRDIMVCGIAWSESDAMAIPFFSQGKVPYWDSHEARARSALSRILTGGNSLVFQNAQYDAPRLESFLGCPIAARHDTMLLHHNVHPELPHNLGYIVSVYGKTPYWKDIVLSSPEAVANQRDETLRRYNLRDCVVLLQVLPQLIAEAKAQKSFDVYQNIALKLVPITIAMTQRGIGLSQSRLSKFRTDLTDRLNDLELQIRHTLQLPESFNIRADQDIRWLLYGLKPAKADKAATALAEYDRNPKLKRGTKKYAELTATNEVFTTVRPFVRTSAAIAKTEGGLPSIDREAMLSLQIAANNRLQLIGKFRKPTPVHRTERSELDRLLGFLRLFGEYNKVDKLLSTYTKFQTGPDGRVHARFVIHGTNTGRLSSRDPNLQNQPSEVKHVFVPTPGYSFVQADFSNLELRVLAYEAGDLVLQQQFADGKNIHDENTRVLFGIDPTHPLWKIARRAAKIYVFGRNYGGGLRGIYEQVAKEVPELGLTFADFTKADEAYFKAHPAYAVWYNTTVERTKASRTSVNAFGRVRYFLGSEAEIVREGLNTPIQSTAADIANESLCDLAECFEVAGGTEEYPAYIVGAVHDSILVETLPQCVELVARDMKAVMEKPRKLWGREVRFPVDIEASDDSWGALKPITEYLNAKNKDEDRPRSNRKKTRRRH